MERCLTTPGAAVTLEKMIARAISRRRGQAGQTTVEYLLTTVTLVSVFAMLYGMMQGQYRSLFRLAAVKILKSYY